MNTLHCQFKKHSRYNRANKNANLPKEYAIFHKRVFYLYLNKTCLTQTESHHLECNDPVMNRLVLPVMEN